MCLGPDLQTTIQAPLTPVRQLVLLRQDRVALTEWEQQELHTRLHLAKYSCRWRALKSAGSAANSGREQHLERGQDVSCLI